MYFVVFSLLCFSAVKTQPYNLNGSGRYVQYSLYKAGNSTDANEQHSMKNERSAFQQQNSNYQQNGQYTTGLYPNNAQNSQSMFDPSKYNPSYPYGTVQNQVGYSNQWQKTGQNQYPNMAQSQNYPYNTGLNNAGRQYDPSSNQNQTEMFQSGLYGNQPNIYGQNENTFYSSSSRISDGNTRIQIHDYSFSNGNCKYEDGYINEKGQRRQATLQDLEKVNQYKKYIEEFMMQMGDWYNAMLKSIPFSQGEISPNFANMPNIPQAPCLCRPENCGSTQQNNGYDGNIQYTQQRGAYQQNATPFGNQYLYNVGQQPNENGAQQNS